MSCVKDGLILLNKKPGITSFDALREIKRALGTGKIGHTGTLDKFAQGLLLVLTGRALKLSRWFSGCDKQYTGKIYFGSQTDTLDPEGVIVAKAPVPPRELVELALLQFIGNIMQSPPEFSAIHINGRRAYEIARSGETPEMKKRPVNIYKLELRSWEPPFAEITVHCSSGTYIRSLARDIALAAGSMAHLLELKRTKIAGFDLEGRLAVSGGLETAGCQPLNSLSPIPVDKTIVGALGLPWYDVMPSEAEKIIHGRSIVPILEDKSPVMPALSSVYCGISSLSTAAVFCGEELIAVVERAGGSWKYGCVVCSSI